MSSKKSIFISTYLIKAFLKTKSWGSYNFNKVKEEIICQTSSIRKNQEAILKMQDYIGKILKDPLPKYDALLLVLIKERISAKTNEKQKLHIKSVNFEFNHLKGKYEITHINKKAYTIYRTPINFDTKEEDTFF